MQPPNEHRPVCAWCGEQPGVEAHTHAGRTNMLCAACHQRITVQEALESRLVHIYRLSGDGHYDEALACLDEIWQANRDRDHDRWLARSVAVQRSVILFDAGRYADDEQALNDWARIGFKDPGDAMFHASATALNLNAQGRTREAVQRLEEGLAHAEPKYLWTAFGLLQSLVDFSEKLGQSIDPRWQALAEAGAKAKGFDLPDWKAKGSSLGEAIREVGAASRARQDKEFAALRAKRAKKSVTKRAKRVKNATSER